MAAGSTWTALWLAAGTDPDGIATAGQLISVGTVTTLTPADYCQRVGYYNQDRVRRFWYVWDPVTLTLLPAPNSQLLTVADFIRHRRGMGFSKR
jgi:hypothetical protein